MSTLILQHLATGNGFRILVITLDRPDQLNALNLTMVEQLYSVLRQASHDPATVAVWLQGSGSKGFCAGGDIKAMYRSAQEMNEGSAVEAERFFQQEYRLDYLLHHYPKPVVCWGDGLVMGGGLGLFKAASHGITTERSILAMPEVTIALYPDVGASHFLTQCTNYSGWFAGLTGARLSAADSIYMGLANFHVSSTQLETLLAAICQCQWSNNAADHSEQMTRLIMPFNHPAGESNMQQHEADITALIANKSLTDIDAAIRNKQASGWLAACFSRYRDGSPLAAGIIFEAFNRHQELSMADVFRSELALSTNMVRDAEFSEGVRALLIDKDKQPAWRYPSVTQVPRACIESFFEPPWPQNPLSDIEQAIL